MKKYFLFLFLFITFNIFCFSQSDVTQMVFPKKIYVGDLAEAHCSFRTGIDFFPDEELLDEKKIQFSRLPFEYDNEDFTIQNAILRRNMDMYTVVFTFIPWKPGLLDFPAFDLYSAVFNESTTPFIVDFDAFEIASILDSREDTTLRPFVSPLLLPGTIYAVYAFFILFLVFVIFVIQVLFRWQAFRDKIKQRQLLKKYARNSRRTFRQFRKLEKNSSKISDIAFCSAVQQIYRVYLSVRFGINFMPLTKNQFMEAFNNATGGVLEGFTVDNLEAIMEIFVRCDYVRFAQNSIDSKKLPKEEYSASLRDGERKEMIETSRAVIKLFERGR